MSDGGKKFELPRNIEHYLAILSKLYGQESKRQLQEIIVRSQVRVHEEWSYDNWDGGMHGHALYLIVPEKIYIESVKEKDAIQNLIKEDLNKVHNYQNEFIDTVFLEMEAVDNQDWRRESGLLLTGTRLVLPEAEKRIWAKEGFRVFLSHKAEVKTEATKLKEQLRLFGVSCFVAHEDIHPTKDWQNEIENALSSMDALVALMTENFQDSDWTDQEVGYAFGRGVPIVSIKLGKDPYGFIGKFQALSCSWDNAAKELVKILIGHDRMLNAYINSVQNCESFEHGNTLAEILPFIDRLSVQQVDLLIHAFSENGQLGSSYGFTGSRPRTHGDGLAHHLSRLTGLYYEKSDGTILIPF